MKTRKGGLATVLVLTSLYCATASSANINVEINGVRDAKGEILVSLFNQTEGWLRTDVGAAKVAALPGVVKATFPNLPAGEYAVSVIHDLNSNGKLDSNLIGIPAEPYGFSNDASGNFGPPTFDQAKFKLGTEHKTVVIRLK